MFDQYASPFQNSLKSVNELFTVNVKIMEQLTELNTALFTGVLEDSVAYVQGLSTQRDIAGLMQAQKSYAESVQEKMVSTAQETYTVLTDAQELASEAMKDTFSQVTESAVAITAAATKDAQAK